MTYASNATGAAGRNPRSRTEDYSLEAGEDWVEPDKPARDTKKLVLVAGLGILSWVATYVGMLELIEANMGELPLIHKLIIGFSVAMLMTMIIWLLDQLFAPINTFTKLCYAAGYVFLTVISVGFGFGFYWKVLESRSESSRSAESAVGQVQGSLHAASTRLEQLSATLVQLSALSTQKADLEREKGTSCPNSKPGDGPRRKMREDDAARFSFASEFVKGRAGAVKGDLGALNGDLALITKDDKSIVDAKSGTRNEFMKALSRKLDMTVTGFNAFRTDPQLKQLRSDLDARAEQTTFGDPKKGGFLCPDPQLQQALRGAVRAIDQLPELQKPEIAAVEGSEATIEAFRRLTATFYGMLAFKLPPSPDELRELQKKAVQSVEGTGASARPFSTEGAGLSKRDYVPLAIALFVDLCLLLVSMGRPMHRLGGLVPKMREAERGPVIQILSRFNDIHRDAEIRQNFELFRHVVFDYHGDYYVAVPLDAPKRMNPDARIDLQHEAHLLANLFTSFEKERIFKRVYNPLLLNTAAIQKRLRRQGSKFAECDAFRTYRFRDGAWSEIILGAVMGAARRVEAAKRRRAAVEDSLTAGTPEAPANTARTAAAAIRLPEPVIDPEPRLGQGRERSSFNEVRMPESVRDMINGRTQSATLGQSRTSQWPSTAEAAPARKPAFAPRSVRPEYQSSYGPYGHSAQSELSAETEAVRAANSNTSPSTRRGEPALDETIVPFSLRATPRVESIIDTSPTAAKSAADAVVRLEPVNEPKIDVVLSRETATVTLPSLDADTLVSRLGRALADTKEITSPTIALPPSTNVIEIAAEDIEEHEDVLDIDGDPATDDAVSIAGRLRPAIPAE